MKYSFLILLLFLIKSISAQNQYERYGCHYNKHFSHQAALFTGVTSSLVNPEPHFTLGVNYKYTHRSWENWCISAMAEMIFEEHKEWLIVIPVVYKANEHVWLRFGVGAELVQNDEGELTISNMPLVRLGGGYDFHWKFLTISPSIDIDIVRRHPSLVAGLNIGYAF